MSPQTRFRFLLAQLLVFGGLGVLLPQHSCGLLPSLGVRPSAKTYIRNFSFEKCKAVGGHHLFLLKLIFLFKMEG